VNAHLFLFALLMFNLLSCLVIVCMNERTNEKKREKREEEKNIFIYL